MDDFTTKLLIQNDELEKEIRELREQAAEQERQSRVAQARADALEEALAERDKASTQAQAAEKARAAAKRVAEKERFSRIGAEGELEELKQRIARLQEQPSRLKKLRDDLGV
jgi:phage shock protein A